MIIYKTTNLINSKVYIGKSKYNRSYYYGSGSLINKAIKKYGKENFIKEILEECSTIDELNIREIYWISKYDSTNREVGYNIDKGGKGGGLGLYKSWVMTYGEEFALIKFKELNDSKKRYKGNNHANFKELALTDSEIIDLYKTMSMNEIAKLCNVTKTKIKSILISNNVKIRNTSESAKLRPLPSIETRKKMSNSRVGDKNHMKGKSLYEIWLAKYGKEIADCKMTEYKLNMSNKLKELNFNSGNNHYSKRKNGKE
jgi:hypothetical protein